MYKQKKCEDFEQLFTYLNDNTNYCLLNSFKKNFPISIEDKKTCINILFEKKSELKNFLNAAGHKNLDENIYKISIENKLVSFQVSFVGDNFVCDKWQQDILKTRVLNEYGIYVPSLRNSFYLLVYFAIILDNDKFFTAYIEEAKDLFYRLELDNKYKLDAYFYPFDLYFKLLNSFMLSSGYTYVKPLNKNIFYNRREAKSASIVSYLTKKYQIQKVEKILVNHLGFGGYYFVGELDKEKVFIKWGGTFYENEYHFTKILYEANRENFVKPYFFIENKNHKFIVLEYVEGVTLKYFLEHNPLPKLDKLNILKQLKNIAQTLVDTKCVHKDLHAENILVTNDNKLKLIDTQSTTVNINSENISELSKKIRRLELKLGIRRPKEDDMVMLSKIIMNSQLYIENDENLAYIINNIGLQEFQHKNLYLRFIRKTFQRLFANLIPHKKLRRFIRDM